MKHLTALTLALAVGLPASIGLAQTEPPAAPDGAPPHRDDGSLGGPGLRGHRLPPLPLLKALDADGDGIIDATEIANAPEALKALDKNGDGQLTPDEYMPQPPHRLDPNGGPGPDGAGGRPPGGFQGPGDHPPFPPGTGPQAGEGPRRRPPPPPLVAALDVNKDGVIDAAEIANAAAALLKLDKNGDGQLTPEEFRPMRRPGQRHPGGPPPHAPVPPVPGSDDSAPQPPGGE